MVIETDINSIDYSGWQDVYFAIKSAKLVRNKNKVPVQTFEVNIKQTSEPFRFWPVIALKALAAAYNERSPVPFESSC